ALRNSMNMNIRARHPDKGRNPDSLKDVERIVELWTDCRKRFGQMSGSGGDLLFGHFTIADAFYAPVVTRFETYAVALPPLAQAYCEAMKALPAMREWIDAGKRETEFV